MARENISTPMDELEIYYDWFIPNKNDHERSKLWYVVAITTAILLLIYSIVTANFLFGVMIILIAFIIIMNDAQSVKNIRCALTSDGVQVGNKVYDYRKFDSFFILYEPPVLQKVIFEMKGMRPDLSLELSDDIDPLELREFLLQILPENLDRENEPLDDALERVLKI